MKLLRRFLILSVVLLFAFASIVFAHSRIPHNCPKAKTPYDHHCHHAELEGGSLHQFPAQCCCYISCFMSGLGLPVN